MDIEGTKNKMVDSSAVENKEVLPTKVIAVSGIMNEYFYPESNGWQSISVRAATFGDANKIYLEKRKPVNPEPVKVEESQETNNEINNE